MSKKKIGNFDFFTKKNDFRVFFLYGQHSVMEPGPTPSPWSIKIENILFQNYFDTFNFKVLK